MLCQGPTHVDQSPQTSVLMQIGDIQVDTVGVGGLRGRTARSTTRDNCAIRDAKGQYSDQRSRGHKESGQLLRRSRLGTLTISYFVDAARTLGLV